MSLTSLKNSLMNNISILFVLKKIVVVAMLLLQLLCFHLVSGSSMVIVLNSHPNTHSHVIIITKVVMVVTVSLSVNSTVNSKLFLKVVTLTKLLMMFAAVVTLNLSAMFIPLLIMNTLVDLMVNHLKD